MASKLIDLARRQTASAGREALRIARGLWSVWQTRPRRPRRRPIMAPYINLRAPSRMFARIFAPIALGVAGLIYGFFFALTAPYLIVPFSTPILILVLMSIWALPDRPHAPTKTMEFFFAALLISLILWPNYLALALPGLPWITAIRLTGFPMAFFYLVSLSTSRDFRSEIKQTLNAVPGLWGCFLVFIAMQFITLPFGKSPALAVQKALLQQINWTSMFIIAVWIFRIPGRVQRYTTMLVLAAIPIVALTLLEFREQHVVWSGVVPSFLKVDDPVAALILQSAIRGATGLYRTKATFSTPLGLSEYLAFVAPFALHYVCGPYRLPTRLFGLVLLPILFYCIRTTDSRLGVVGFLVTLLLYLLFWGVLRLFRDRGDLFASAVVYAYPAFFGAFGVAVMFVHRIHRMVFGDGATAASNEARANQLHMGIPKMFANPIGHGAGQSGAAMGYGANEFITIDNYYLTLGLDYGFLGLFMFLAIFLVAIRSGFAAIVKSSKLKDRELNLLIPLTILLSEFLVIKMVFSQPDNHPIIYACLGMLVALVARVRDVTATEAAEPAKAVAPARRPAGRLVAAKDTIGPRSPAWP